MGPKVAFVRHVPRPSYVLYGLPVISILIPLSLSHAPDITRQFSGNDENAATELSSVPSPRHCWRDFLFGMLSAVVWVRRD